jgi:AmmeMemoRadiSam system protein B
MHEELSVRKPAVAGMFYPDQPKRLRELISKLLSSEKNKIKTELATQEIIGGVVPHAGYIYSGYEAVHFFELVRLSGKEFDTIIIVNPDHQGYSPEFATSPHDYWETPLGSVQIDRELADIFPQSELAHSREHSAEVMLPFIQIFFNQKIKILPISIGSSTPETAKKLANKIFDAISQTNRKALIIASSDFSHYVDPLEGISQDDIALDRIFAKDSIGLYQMVKKYGITVCGYGPIMTLIEYSLLCSKSPKIAIAARGNSGKNSPSKSVVDYITIVFTA